MGGQQRQRGRRGAHPSAIRSCDGGTDSPHMLSNGERKQEDSYCLSNRLVLVVGRRGGPG